MTWEEYKNERATHNIYKNNQHYIKTDIECPNCGEFIYKNISLALTSYPPQYQFHCEKCGWYGTSQ